MVRNGAGQSAGNGSERRADAERLKGSEYSRATVGEYHIIFDVCDGVLRVVAIGKRNDDEVYRRLG